jgi:hypothetical protein
MRLTSIAIMTAITALMGISAVAEEKSIQLRQSPGLDAVEVHCSACHSLDYVQMNSPFLSAAGWEAEVAKMINAFGAPIDQADAKTIADYLNKNYGSESFHALTAHSAGTDSSSLREDKSFPQPSLPNLETARENARELGTPHVGIPRTSSYARSKRTSFERQSPFCLFCVARVNWLRSFRVFATTGSSLGGARRRAARAY